MLKLEHINKVYRQGKSEVPVLHDITLHVEHGEFVAIMGPSGSGKSTLMNLIGLLDTPTSGNYFFDGTEVNHCTENQLSNIRNEKIGFVFQNFNLLPRQSALENAALPLLYAGVKPKVRRERAREALVKVGLEERISFLPTQLSGGQKQRVAIARAMINHPKLLLADEPTGALDTASGKQVMQLFHDLHQTGVTIVMITHEPEIAAHAERMFTIRDGRLGEEASI
ncbi:MAG: ABC transporter ATP-binding protein [Oscillospiraceae bacterium]|nr:ABC transporter ATP-binding protein [Oscillospiraceae bacterium]